MHSPGQVGRVGNVAGLEPAADFVEDALLTRLVFDMELRVGRGDEREHEVSESPGVFIEIPRELICPFDHLSRLEP